MSKKLFFPVRFSCYLLLLSQLLALAYASSKRDISIGVLAVWGEDRAQQMWEPTIRYLETQTPEYRYKLLPLTLAQMQQAVANDELDFILTNTGNYVNLEAKYGITRVATLKNSRQGGAYTSFGAVVFVRADRTDINSLKDLKDRSFAAVSKKAFGGFQMAWREFKDAGIDPFEDFSRLEFIGFPQDNIVKSVLDGKIDAGTVRSDTLRRMAANGEIDLDQIKVLNPQQVPGFPFLLSTRLYPEWPFARARKTPDEFATEVAIALLRLSGEHPASIAGRNAGWTVPLSYQSVHDLFRELKIGAYAEMTQVTLRQIIIQYRYWLILMVIGLLFAAYHYKQVERLVRIRTEELSSANQSLENEMDVRVKSEQEAHTYRDHLQLLMNSTAEGIFGVDKEGLCTFVNRNCVQMLGYQSETEILDKPLATVINFSTLDAVDQGSRQMPVLDAIGQAEIWHSDSEMCHRVDGSTFAVEYWVHPIENNAVIEGHVITFIDISRRKMIDAELTQHREHLAKLVEERTRELKTSNQELQENITRLQQTQSQLVQAEKMASLGGLVAGVAHEINTPLGIGITSSSHIQEEILKLKDTFESGGMARSELERFIDHNTQGCDILMHNLQRASALIRSFKSVAVDQSSDEWRTIDLRQYIDEVILSIKPKWNNTPVTLVNECDPDLNIYSHPGAIYQIVSNLAINALIYAFDEGQAGCIQITAKFDKDKISLNISDNGNGIPKQHQDSIFEPFYTTRRGSGGSGLGLHIVYNQVTATLKGTIKFTSSAEEGSLFYIVFPFRTEAIELEKSIEGGA